MKEINTVINKTTNTPPLFDKQIKPQAGDFARGGDDMAFGRIVQRNN